jgi:hypothetical protein
MECKSFNKLTPKTITIFYFLFLIFLYNLKKIETIFYKIIITITKQNGIYCL